MARIKLTAGRVRDFTTEKGQEFLWDTDAPGLAVRATAPGKRNSEGGKAYIYQGKLEGRDLRITIGDVRAWSLEDARIEARRLQGLVDQGVDPRQEKQERVEAAAAKVAAVKAAAAAAEKASAPAIDAWHAYIAARTPKWGALHLADHIAAVSEGGQPRTRGRRPGEADVTLPGALRDMMLLPLHQIDADRVKAWLADEAARRPTHAAKMYRLLRAFLGWCAFHPDYRDQVHADACAGRIVKDELPKPKAKTDSLQREQLPAWFAAVRQIGNPVIAAYLQSLLLTGARREELAGLRWEDVDFQWNSLAIHDKVEGERIIPLTPFVAHLLAALPRRNHWVFSAVTGATGRLQDPYKAHSRAVVAAGLPALSIHGLRRSFGSLTEWCEVPTGVVAQIMGHKPSATAEKHYRVRPLDLLRSWHVKIEAWILEQAGIDFAPVEKPGVLRVVAS